MDVSRLAATQTAVRSLGLLVITQQLADAATQQERAESQDGEAISTTPPATTNTNIGLEGMTTTKPGRGEVPVSNAAVATPETQTKDAAPAANPPVMYFPVSLDPGATTFSIDVPSGPHQQLFLYGFGDPPADGSMPIPIYTAAALDVVLEPGSEKTVTFIAYPAGVVVPQILRPSLIGLVDANGRPLSSVPDDLSCLSVARADAPREGFPADMVTKIRVGSIAANTAIGPASVLVLPVGSYKLSCFAQFAGKLFAVNPPVSVRVDQGRVTVASGSLVKIKDLAVSDVTGATVGTSPGPTTGDTNTNVTGGVIVPPGADGTQILPPGGTLPPRFTAHLSLPAGAQAPAGGSATESAASNFANASDLDITVFARSADGSIDRTFTGEVALRVTPALSRTLALIEQGQAGAWKPFAGAADGATGGATLFDELRLFVVDGVATAPNGLRVGHLAVPGVTGDAATIQLVLSVHPVDGSGFLTRAFGARFFTVRRDTACTQPLAFDQWFVTTLTDRQNELTVKLDVATRTFNALKEHLLLVALTAPSATGPSRCVFTQGVNAQTVYLIPLDMGSANKIQPLQPFLLQTITLALSTGPQTVPGYLMKQVPGPDGQTVLFDAIQATAPLQGASFTVGSQLFTDLGYTVYDAARTSVPNPPTFKLNAFVR